MVAQSGKISDTTTLLESLSPNSDSISRARGDVKIFIVYKGDTVQIPVNPSDLKKYEYGPDWRKYKSVDVFYFQ